MDWVDEAMVGEHGDVAGVVVDTRYAAVPFDAHGNLIAADLRSPRASTTTLARQSELGKAMPRLMAGGVAAHASMGVRRPRARWGR